MLVMAGKPVDATIESLMQYLEPGDCIIDGGNEWCALHLACTGHPSNRLQSRTPLAAMAGCFARRRLFPSLSVDP